MLLAGRFVGTSPCDGSPTLASLRDLQPRLGARSNLDLISLMRQYQHAQLIVFLGVPRSIGCSAAAIADM